MDKELSTLISELAEKNQGEKSGLRFGDRKAGELELVAKSGNVKYTLKPLEELFGAGHGFSSVDPMNHTYNPLLQRIEETILRQWDADESLTDGLVSLTLDRMGANPSCAPGNDALCRVLQTDLRLFLSFQDFSKQEVKQACRVISKSVQRHTKAAGVTGYLEFIERMFSQGYQ